MGTTPFSNNRKAKKLLYLLVSTILVGSVVAASIISRCYWNSNDDPTIAYLLSRTNNSYAPFIGRVCAFGVHYLYMSISTVNWWIVVNYVGIFIGLLTITVVIFSRYQFRAALLINTLVCCASWYAALKQPCFTRTAAIISLGGCALIANMLFPQYHTPNIDRMVGYVAGCIFILLGLQIRSSSVVIALSMLASYVLVKMGMENFSFKKSEIRKWLPRIALAGCVPCVFLAGVAVDKLFVSDEENKYEYYNSLRSRIEDYDSQYRNYNGNSKSLSNEDLDTFLSWYSEDTEVFTKDKLKATADSGKCSISLNECFREFSDVFQNSKANCSMVVICVGVYFLLCISNHKKYILICLIPAIVSIVLMTSLLCYGRLPQWVSSPIVYSMMICYLLLGSDIMYALHEKIRNTPKARRYIVSWAVSCFAIVMAVTFYHTQIKPYYGAYAWTPDNKVLDYINEKNDKVFIFPLSSGTPPLVAESAGMWSNVPQGYCNNFFWLGGWDARLPINISRLAAYGVDNPTRALFEKDNIYSTHSETTVSFLRRHYGEDITESEVMRFNGICFTQYSKHISESKIKEQTTIDNIEYNITSDSRVGGSGWSIKGHLYDGFDGDSTIYCNVTIGDVRYTYKLYVDDDGEFDTFFYAPTENSQDGLERLVFFTNG